MTSISRLLPRRRLLQGGIALLAGAALPAAWAQGKSRDISWDDLVPQGWDPTASFLDLKGTENLPYTDPRAQKLLDRIREVWDNAPVVQQLEGRQGRIPGYLVPLEQGKDGLREFLLVPYFGACIHTPPPPANQIVRVRADKPVKGLRTMDAVWVTGTMHIERSDSSMGVSGYAMSAERVVKYPQAR